MIRIISTCAPVVGRTVPQLMITTVIMNARISNKMMELTMKSGFVNGYGKQFNTERDLILVVLPSLILVPIWNNVYLFKPE